MRIKKIMDCDHSESSILARGKFSVGIERRVTAVIGAEPGDHQIRTKGFKIFL